MRIMPLALIAASAAFLMRVDTLVAQTLPAEPQTRAAAVIEDGLTERQARIDRLDMRERLLEATEKRVEAKLASLRAHQGVRAPMQKSETRTMSLVRLYAAMRPKDAARIFETLDMNVQAAVALRMREVKMAAIMSEMNPRAAGALTMALAKRPATLAEPS